MSTTARWGSEVTGYFPGDTRGIARHIVLILDIIKDISSDPWVLRKFITEWVKWKQKK